MEDELIQDAQPQDVAEVSGPAPIDSIHAAATAIAALNARIDFVLQYGDAISARLDKLEGKNAQA